MFQQNLRPVTRFIYPVYISPLPAYPYGELKYNYSANFYFLLDSVSICGKLYSMLHEQNQNNLWPARQPLQVRVAANVRAGHI